MGFITDRFHYKTVDKGHGAFGLSSWYYFWSAVEDVLKGVPAVLFLGGCFGLAFRLIICL